MEIAHLTDLKVPKAILISRIQQKTNTSWNNFKAIKYFGGGAVMIRLLLIRET
jgi:hypothetical protein